MKEKIMEQFKENNSDRTIEKTYAFSVDCYLVYAPITGLKNDKNGSYFIVNKKTGLYRAFSPFEDFDRFDNAIHNGEIKN